MIVKDRRLYRLGRRGDGMLGTAAPAPFVGDDDLDDVVVGDDAE
jgi:hypothetical protein